MKKTIVKLTPPKQIVKVPAPPVMVRMNFAHKLYILMRNDIPSMNPGKAMAQAAHAANDLIARWGLKQSIIEWSKEAETFGTTIVLTANFEELKHTMERASLRNGSVPYGLITDPTYPFMANQEVAALIPQSNLSAAPIFKENGQVVLFRKEITCGYVFVVDGSSDQEELVGHLLLHP